MRSGWLLRDGDVVCALEMCDSAAERRRGLRGRSGFDGALHLGGTRAVHTLGVGFPIDVAFLSADLTVLRVTRLKPWRVALVGPGARSVVQAEAGWLERWGVRAGDQLEVREAE
ncbi:MAG TPA: DUF192 domain-containing protein [Acidimicrobiales bacterium]|nr:DUF192 domain-containing protein [Acidimicrobiales bacterium]